MNNTPIVAFCNTNSNVDGIDLVVPLNITNKRAVGVGLWLIANEILKIRGEKPVELENFIKGTQQDTD